MTRRADIACPRFLTAPQLSAEYGRTPRHWIRLAAQGKIPGAYQPCGKGSHWAFDRKAFAAWWDASRREEIEWQGSTGEARRGGDVSSVRP